MKTMTSIHAWSITLALVAPMAACSAPPVGDSAESATSGSEGVTIVHRPIVPAAFPTGVAIASDGHACLRNGDGTVQCWGANNFGQLGDGTTLARALPVSVLGLAGAVQVATSYGSSCALLGNGTVECWGELLLASNLNGVTTPTPIPNVTNAVSITAGDMHFCVALASGGATCWGRNSAGQIGVPVSSSGYFDATSVPGVANIVSVTAGISHTCALDRYGRVFCWGDGGSGQLGSSNATYKSNVAATMMTPLTSTRQISAAGNNTCALGWNGVITCWGEDRYETASGASAPGPAGTFHVIAGLAPAIDVAMAQDHACAILSDATVRCWGITYALGDGLTTPLYRTGSAIAPVTGAATLSAGTGEETCAVVGSNVLCWGDGEFITTATPTTIY